MRRTFQPAGFVTEAHYREAWPADGGAVFGSVAYAILRHDWQSGTTTPVDLGDFPSVGLHRSQPHLSGGAGSADCEPGAGWPQEAGWVNGTRSNTSGVADPRGLSVALSQSWALDDPSTVRRVRLVAAVDWP
ncbi:hypothetical protein RCH11_001094 [Glaciihabitans sp. GrIS 2.15]|nr:hypothetical protein [Glaciihabitans sp. GrIS 2.15]